MGLIMEFVPVVMPLVVIGVMVIFVIERIKYNQGNLVKKQSKGTQDLLASLIPMGMIFGCAIGVILSMFFPISLLSAVSLGAGIGYLFGFFAYEIYGKKGTTIRK